MKKLLLLCLFLGLCGCSPNAREPERLAPVRVLGVDGRSPVALTAICDEPGAGEPLRASCVGESLDLALGRIPWAADAELSLSGTGWVICGPDTDVAAVLFAALEDRQLSPTATVWLAEAEAERLLAAVADPAAELELLERQGVNAPTAARALGALLTEGDVRLPVLAEEDGRLVLRGEVLWSEG